ncbi:MAG: metallophosphoesterase, partial [Clostridia bacterium]|nr:metallophosphoesterase [Clostridia bacterium]
MKKAISVILCITVLLSFIIIPVSASNNGCDLKFAVASDLHYNQPEEFTDYIDDEIFFYANRRAAMENQSGFIIDEFLNQCAESDVQYVLISGDMADNGRSDPEEHLIVARKLRDFEQKTGKDVFVIDGNHDLGEGSLTDITQFKKIYSDFGYDKAVETVENDCSYTANLGEKYRLIALDSCDPTVSTEDGMSLKKTNWVLKQAEKAYDDGRYPILMMHHNLLDHMPLQRIFSSDLIVR